MRGFFLLTGAFVAPCPVNSLLSSELKDCIFITIPPQALITIALWVPIIKFSSIRIIVARDTAVIVVTRAISNHIIPI